MTRPEMILFDYGHTLLYEPGYNFTRGQRAVFEHIAENPQNVTLEQINEFGTELFYRAESCRKLGFEVHEIPLLRLIYERFGIKLDISYEEAEIILWHGTSEGECMPNVGKMLTYLNEHGIRSGVISNLGWSGRALTHRINRLIPENRFEFIMASSDYVVRKPDPLIFETAIAKAGLPAEKVWFCGDNITADVRGAHDAGMFPVRYEGVTASEPNPFAKYNEGLTVDFEHLHIHDWTELIDVLENI